MIPLELPQRTYNKLIALSEKKVEAVWSIIDGWLEREEKETEEKNMENKKVIKVKNEDNNMPLKDIIDYCFNCNKPLTKKMIDGKDWFKITKYGEDYILCKKCYKE